MGSRPSFHGHLPNVIGGGCAPVAEAERQGLKNMNGKTLLMVDAILNFLFGIILLVFPRILMPILGIPIPDQAF
jgi:hypothetical protein